MSTPAFSPKSLTPKPQSPLSRQSPADPKPKTPTWSPLKTCSTASDDFDNWKRWSFTLNQTPPSANTVTTVAGAWPSGTKDSKVKDQCKIQSTPPAKSTPTVTSARRKTKTRDPLATQKPLSTITTCWSIRIPTKDKSPATTHTLMKPAETRNLTADEPSANAIEVWAFDSLYKPPTGLSITTTNGTTLTPVFASPAETEEICQTAAAVNTTTLTLDSHTLAALDQEDAVDKRPTIPLSAIAAQVISSVPSVVK